MNVVRMLTRDFTVIDVEDTGMRDEFGDATEQTTPAGPFKCWLSQTARTEETANADTQAQTWDLYLEAAADGHVDGSSRGTVDGVTYELVGPPWPARNARTGRLEYVEATVRKVA